MPKIRNVKRSRERTKPTRKWTDVESLSMIYYILDKQNDGKPFEKPTAEKYYDKMIEKLELKDVKWQQIKAKMQYFRTKFVLVKTWLEGTGQGVDSGTIEDYKKKKCPYYEELHGIFAAKANISIPYQYDSLRDVDSTANDSSKVEECSQANVEGIAQENSANDHRAVDVDLQGSHLNPDNEYVSQGNDEYDLQLNDEHDPQVNDDFDNEIDLTSSDDHVSNNLPAANDVNNSNSQERSASTQGSKSSQRQYIEEEELNFAQFTRNTGESEEDEIHEPESTRLARFKKQLLDRPSGKASTSKTPSNASAFISDANIKRAETLHERNQIELRRVENEKFEMDLSKERFALDKELHLEQLNLSKQDTRIRKHELSLKETEQKEKFDLRKLNHDLKCKKLSLKEKENQDAYDLKLKELEKAERLEKMKMELDFKLQLELAKLKN